MLNRHPKTILLDFDLFLDLYVYACRHAEPKDLQYIRLRKGVHLKLEAMMRHELYSLYKSGADEETRRKAKSDYLDAIGLSDSFRWSPEQDVNVMHTDLDFH